MSRIEIEPDRRDARRAEKALRAMTGKRMLAALRKTVNEGGKALRKDMGEELPAVLHTARARLRMRAKAAYSGQEKPRYRLSIARYVPDEGLKPSARRIIRSGRRGKKRSVLRLVQPEESGGTVRLGPVMRTKGKGAKHRLLATETRRERGTSGAAVGAVLRGQRGERMRKRAGQAMLDALREHIEEALQG